MGRWLLAHTATGDPLMALVLRDAATSSALARAARARRSSAAGATAPDGTRLSWRVAGRDAALGARPFFIAWDDPAMRPGLLDRAARRRGARHPRASRSAAAPSELEGWVDGGRAGAARSATAAGCARS